MQIYVDEVLALVEQVGAFMGLDQNPRLWEVATVCKSWSHYDKLSSFAPVMCIEFTYRKDDVEWVFLVSPWFDREDRFSPDGLIWRDAGAYSARLRDDSGLRFVLDISGRPLFPPVRLPW